MVEKLAKDFIINKLQSLQIDFMKESGVHSDSIHKYRTKKTEDATINLERLHSMLFSESQTLLFYLESHQDIDIIESMKRLELLLPSHIQVQSQGKKRVVSYLRMFLLKEIKSLNWLISDIRSKLKGACLFIQGRVNKSLEIDEFIESFTKNRATIEWASILDIHSDNLELWIKGIKDRVDFYQKIGERIEENGFVFDLSKMINPKDLFRAIRLDFCRARGPNILFEEIQISFKQLTIFEPDEGLLDSEGLIIYGLTLKNAYWNRVTGEISDKCEPGFGESLPCFSMAPKFDKEFTEDDGFKCPIYNRLKNEEPEDIVYSIVSFISKKLESDWS